MSFLKGLLGQNRIYGNLSKLWKSKIKPTWTEHDDLMLKFYTQFVSDGDLCFDVGANIGNRTRIFLKLGCNVVAVEPQEECIRMLRSLYRKKQQLIIISQALGASEGIAELMVSNASTISSFSKEWIESVRQSGRFSEYKWQKRQNVPLTTLDNLILEYGAPKFIKIDVEGFEYEVIKGLSRPVNVISFEFVPEILAPTFGCIQHLQTLGDICFNYSLGETMRLMLDEWVSSREIVEIISGYEASNVFGDVYARFV
jgi:FkbM family methyltransferase